MRTCRAAILAILLYCAAQNLVAAENPVAVPTLLKPAPTDFSPFLPKAEAAARDRYPELFQGKFSGTIGIYVDLNIEGAILSMKTIQFPAGPISDRSLSKERRDAMLEVTVHDAYVRAGALGTKFISWFGSTRANGLYLYYRVLKWPLDPARSVGRVQAAVAKRYPQYFARRPLSTAEDDSTESVVTVVMNDDGAIETALLIEHANWEETSERRTLDRFLELGLKPEQLAYRGRTTNRGDWQDKNLTAPLLVIEYAWRRINDDPPDEVLQSFDVFDQQSLLHLQEQARHPPDEDFLKRYFRGVWENGLPPTVDGVWILLSRSGEVLDTGTASEHDVQATEEQIQKRYPGIKTQELISAAAKSQMGSPVSLYYVWIAPDSPVMPK